MTVIQRENQGKPIELAAAKEALKEYFRQADYSGKKVLLIVPDHTRSGPIGEIFQMIYDGISDKAEKVDVLVALGTHQPMTQEHLCRRLGISQTQRETKYRNVGLYNHQWSKPETFTCVGEITADEIEQLSQGLFRESVPVAINKMIFDYDQLLILGPVFPHEVVGFSGGHKYLFPGIAGQEIINFFHWLGAVITNPAINGEKWTATRRVVEKAASFITVPRKLVAIVAIEEDLRGIFIGEVIQAWEKAADLSSRVHVVYKDHPYHTVLGLAPRMYDDIWTAGKVMYKLEPVVADGGKLIIHAPHIDEVSYTHGKWLDRIGYHVRDYFMTQPEKFKDVPRGVMAHSTHVKGVGAYENGIEKPRVEVILATRIPKQRCEKINLGYMDPDTIDPTDYAGREDEGVLLVDHAGEQLHRLRGQG